MLGQGVFTVPEASRLTGVSQQQLRRWFGGSSAIFEAARWGHDVNLTFADVISALFIKALRGKGVTMGRIRKAAKKAADQLGAERPFALPNFATDGKEILQWVVSKSPGRRRPRKALVGLSTDQAVIEPFLRPFLQNIEFGEHEAKRWWPHGKRAAVVVDPQFSFGRPVTAKHRIPTSILYAAHKAGERPERIARWYDIPKAEVLAAVRFETKLDAAA